MAKQAVPEKQPELAKEWKDISNEQYRRYAMVTQFGIGEVTVHNPKGLKEEKVQIGQDQFRTDHILLDEKGEQHRIEGGWIKISFKLKE
jgi:hypothetical protein